MKCPVCGKKNDIATSERCQQCDTDLSIYPILERLHPYSGKNNKFLIWLSCISICFVFFLSLYFFIPAHMKTQIIYRDNTEKINTQLLEHQNDSLKKIIKLKKTASIVKYIVRKGDNIEKISKNLFNDDKHSQKIINDNRLNNPGFLVPGEILYIDYSQN